MKEREALCHEGESQLWEKGTREVYCQWKVQEVTDGANSQMMCKLNSTKDDEESGCFQCCEIEIGINKCKGKKNFRVDLLAKINSTSMNDDLSDYNQEIRKSFLIPVKRNRMETSDQEDFLDEFVRFYCFDDVNNYLSGIKWASKEIRQPSTETDQHPQLRKKDWCSAFKMLRNRLRTAIKSFKNLFCCVSACSKCK